MIYAMTTRSYVDGAFTRKPGVTRYLKVEKIGAGFAVQILPLDTWLAEVLAAAGGMPESSSAARSRLPDSPCWER